MADQAQAAARASGSMPSMLNRAARSSTHSGGFEVYHQPELVVGPHLVVAVQVAVHQHGRAG